MNSSIIERADSSCVNLAGQGNADLYGLGIRVGIHLQWISALLIPKCYPAGRGGLYEAYTIFLVAVMIVAVVINEQATTTAIDMFILAYIIFGGMFTALSIDVDRRLRSEARISLVQNITMYLVLVAAGTYYACFWLQGISAAFFARLCDVPYGFLFGQISLYDKPNQDFFAACSIFMAWTGVLGVIDWARTVYARYQRKDPSPRKDVTRLKALGSPMARNNTILRRKVEVLASKVGPYVSAFTLVYSVVGIELTIHWNHVDDMYVLDSTGQLIPFTIGVLGLAKVLCEPVRKSWKGREQVRVLFLCVLLATASVFNKADFVRPACQVSSDKVDKATDTSEDSVKSGGGGAGGGLDFPEAKPAVLVERTDRAPSDVYEVV